MAQRNQAFDDVCSIFSPDSSQPSASHQAGAFPPTDIPATPRNVQPMQTDNPVRSSNSQPIPTDIPVHPPNVQPSLESNIQASHPPNVHVPDVHFNVLDHDFLREGNPEMPDIFGVSQSTPQRMSNFSLKQNTPASVNVTWPGDSSAANLSTIPPSLLRLLEQQWLNLSQGPSQVLNNPNTSIVHTQASMSAQHQFNTIFPPLLHTGPTRTDLVPDISTLSSAYSTSSSSATPSGSVSL